MTNTVDTDPVAVPVADVDLDVERARAGDAAAFARLVAPLRRELQAHCYRLLGSSHDAEDAVQNALLQAWRGLGGFERRSSLRTWLYTVATRCALDVVRGDRRRALPVDLGPASADVVTDDRPRTEVAWLGPWVGAVGPGATVGPAARFEQREAVELAFVAALQHLPGNQRAALVLVEVVGYSPAEVAAMMATSVASVNSALQRARAVVSARVPDRSQQQTLRVLGDARVRELVEDFAGALERGDAGALVALLCEDVTWSMPPLPGWYAGRPSVARFVEQVPLGACGAWRWRAAEANAQPALALYLRPDGHPTFDAWSLNVLTLRDGEVADVTSFIGAEHVAACGLPTTVS